jgi:hypothetical protein
MTIDNIGIPQHQLYVGQLDVAEDAKVDSDSSIAAIHAEAMNLDPINQDELTLLLGTSEKNAAKAEFETPESNMALIFTRGQAIASTGDLVLASGKVTQTEVSTDAHRSEQGTLNEAIEQIYGLEGLNQDAIKRIAGLRQA